MAKKYYDVIREKLKKKKKNFTKLSVISMDVPNREVEGVESAFGGGRGVYTGAGPDGVVQPDRPAMVDRSGGQPRVLHEGEMAEPTPNGVKVTPANETQQFMSNVQVPQTEAEQFEIDKMQKSTGTPGFQAGGTYRYGN